VIYIYKNDQQSGPYEEHIVLEQLKSGVLSPNDLAVRHGETRWQPLSDMFPETIAAAPLPPPVSAPMQPAVTTPRSEPRRVAVIEPAAPLYRKTLLQKIFFGLVFLASLAALAGAGYLFWRMATGSGDLQADLRNLSFRILVRNAAIGLFVAAFLSFIAFLLTFKRKIIASNALRILVRAVFIFVLLLGVAEFGIGVYSYLTYTNPYVSSVKASDQNELLKAMQEGEAVTGPYESAVIHLPISAGLVILGLSGILMTRRAKPTT
jgi:hypothetical protein